LGTINGDGKTVVRAAPASSTILLVAEHLPLSAKYHNTVTAGRECIPTGAVIEVGGGKTAGVGNIVASASPWTVQLN